MASMAPVQKYPSPSNFLEQQAGEVVDVHVSSRASLNPVQEDS